jgi:hypothetical protein
MRALWAAVLLGCSGTTFVGVSTDAGSADSASDDGGPSDASAAGDGARHCTAIPNIVDNCSQDNECTFGAERIDCCGTILYVGFNQSFAADFKTAEGTLEATCACKCPPAQSTTQDGQVVFDAGRVTARCRNRQCRTTTN